MNPQQPYRQQPYQQQYGYPAQVPLQRPAYDQRQPTGQQAWPPPPPAPAKKRRKWPWVVLVVVALLVVILASSAKSGAPSSSTGSSPQAVAEEPAAPAGPPASAPTDYSGKGDDVVTIKKDAGPAIVTFECPKCSRNTILQSDGADSLLVNTIGSYSGRRLIDSADGSSTGTLTVKATGSWKITVASGLGSAKRAETNVAGRGDDVAVLTGNISKAAITNKGGSSNFVVQAYESSSSFPNLAVNTIGGYSGTVPISGPAVLAITSNGSWTVTGS